ncbi:hypothetical protein LA303_05270 [Candidatus Sulfidibacterium hydrothermale]|uniref:hypothetical protein n=1 Tax=Candidatus Sulfidibacterium hydrothermale TaxID=2875962 RepID=UPI001F0AF6E0|nr:hypothetical protein [Candidatus Sulfidibacterium hydrothermale]UBM63377.1 hypothetical protein LA303_05270 [Candidatus Sulfidibacterium hydrothermale]
MILLAFVLFYVLLVVASAVYLWRNPADRYGQEGFMTLFLKKKTSLFSGRGKVSRFVMTYKCPHCGFETSDPVSSCPHCRAEGKKVSMVSLPSLLPG